MKMKLCENCLFGKKIIGSKKQNNEYLCGNEI